MYQNRTQESDYDAIFNVNDYCMKDKIVLLSRFDSRQPCDRSALVLDFSIHSESMKLLGGGSAYGKNSY